MNIFIDWTKEKAPWQEGEFYYVTYKTNILSKKEQNFNDKLIENIKEAINYIFKFYSKQEPSEQDLNQLVFINNLCPIYIGRRIGCDYIKILVKVSKNVLDSYADDISSLDYKYSLNYTLSELEDDIRYVVNKLKVYPKILEKNEASVYLNNIEVKFDNSLSNFNKYYTILKSYCLKNGISSQNEPFDILFDNKYNFAGIYYNDKYLKKTLNQTTKNKVFRDKFAVRLLVYSDNIINNRATSKPNVIDALEKSESDSALQSKVKSDVNNALLTTKASNLTTHNKQWRIVLETLPDVTIDVSEMSILLKQKLFGSIEDDFLKNVNPKLPNNLNEDYWRKFVNIEDVNDFILLKKCENITEEDLKRLYRSKIDKEKLDIALRDSSNRIKAWSDSLSKKDPVQKGFCDIDFDSASANTLDIYKEILNKYSLDVLLKESLSCLKPGFSEEQQRPDRPEQRPDRPEQRPGRPQDEVCLPTIKRKVRPKKERPKEKICFDNYNPFALDFFDDLQTASLFGTITDIVKEALEILAQQILISTLKIIFSSAQECCNGSILSFGFSKEDLFKQKLDEAEKYLANKFNSPETAVEDIKSVLNDIGIVLTPKETVDLFSGNASDETLELVECIIKNRHKNIADDIENIDDVSNVFSNLDVLLDPAILELATTNNPPNSAAVNNCFTDEMEELRNSLSRRDDVSLQEIDKQVEAEKQRKESKIKFLENILANPEEIVDLALEKTPEEAAMDMVPCVADNENLNFIVQTTIDSTLDALTSVFSLSLVGHNGISTYSFADFIADISSLYGSGRNLVKPSVIRDFDFEYFYTDEENKKIYKSGSPAQLLMNSDKTFLLSNPENPYSNISFIGGGNWRRVAFKEVVESENDFDATDELYDAIYEEIVKIIHDQTLVTNAQLEADKFKDNIDKIANDINNTGIDILMDSWGKNNNNVKIKALSTFNQIQCQTKDPNALVESIIAALFYIYSRAKILEVCISNMHLVGKIDFKVFLDTFLQHYLAMQMSTISEFSCASRLIDDDMKIIIKQQLESISSILWDIMGINEVAGGKKSLVNMILDHILSQTSQTTQQNLRIGRSALFFNVQEDPISYIGQINFVQKDNGSVRVFKIFSKKIPKTQNVTLQQASLQLRQMFLEDKEIYKFFDFIFPSNDILSILSIYNVNKFMSLGKYNPFNMFYKIVENIIEDVFYGCRSATSEISDVKSKSKNIFTYKSKSEEEARKDTAQKNKYKDLTRKEEQKNLEDLPQDEEEKQKKQRDKYQLGNSR